MAKGQAGGQGQVFRRQARDPDISGQAEVDGSLPNGRAIPPPAHLCNNDLMRWGATYYPDREREPPCQ